MYDHGYKTNYIGGISKLYFIFEQDMRALDKFFQGLCQTHSEAVKDAV